MSRKVDASFAIPPGAPPDVAEAYARFSEAGDRYASRLVETEDAEEAVEAARIKDRERATAAVLEGKEPKDLDKNERAAQVKLDALRATVPAFGDAVNETRNDLFRAIGKAKARGDWVPGLEAMLAEDRADYGKAIAAAQAALGKIKQASGALRWLERFDVGEASVGRVTPYLGSGRVFVENERHGPLRGQHDPAKLLELAAVVADPPEIPDMKSKSLDSQPSRKAYPLVTVSS